MKYSYTARGLALAGNRNCASNSIGRVDQRQQPLSRHASHARGDRDRGRGRRLPWSRENGQTGERENASATGKWNGTRAQGARRMTSDLICTLQVARVPRQQQLLSALLLLLVHHTSHLARVLNWRGGGDTPIPQFSVPQSSALLSWRWAAGGRLIL